MAVAKRGSIFHYQFQIDGTIYRGSTNETTLTKARLFEEMLMARIRMGEHQATKAPILKDFALRYIDHIEKRLESGALAPQSVRNYKNGWRLLAATSIAGYRLDRIGTPDAEELTFPGGSSNANMALRTLRCILSYAADLKLLRAAPKIKLREKVDRLSLIEPYIENLLLEYASDYMRLMIIVILDCGMRPEEVCRLRWEEIYWDRNVILIPEGKTGRATRFVGLSDRMAEELKLWQQSNDSEWVFPSDGGKSGQASASGHLETYSKAWTAAKKLVVSRIRKERLPPLPKDLVLYTARHTYATNFLAAGGDIAKLAKLMGHADISTTMKYLHPSTSDAAEFINKHNRNKAALKIVRSA